MSVMEKQKYIDFNSPVVLNACKKALMQKIASIFPGKMVDTEYLREQGGPGTEFGNDLDWSAACDGYIKLDNGLMIFVALRCLQGDWRTVTFRIQNTGGKRDKTEMHKLIMADIGKDNIKGFIPQYSIQAYFSDVGIVDRVYVCNLPQLIPNLYTAREDRHYPYNLNPFLINERQGLAGQFFACVEVDKLEGLCEFWAFENDKWSYHKKRP